MSDMGQAKTDPSPRNCTCHPSDNPPRPCPRKHALSECRLTALVEAMDQLLDDMGPGCQSVSLAAKAQARVAFEPFRDKAEPADWLMSMENAERILRECDR